MKPKILVTSALVYANGPIHLGHILEYIQTDIFVRAQRMLGADCIYISGDDAHGTPIMLAAKKQEVSPEQLISEIGASHRRDAEGFNIDFSFYGNTNSPTNKELTTEYYRRMLQNGDITTQLVEQAYDEKLNMFLPDRYVKGTCPRCQTKEQYGDSCESCGATYSPLDLITPYSALSGEPITKRSSEHYFFKLSRYQDWLKTWCPQKVASSLVHKLDEWLGGTLQDWDISRDEPYFGFEIPGAAKKYFYVWLDAPFGYLANTKDFCKQHNLDFDEFWGSSAADTKIYHFIGKDIIYFHALFWPAVLKSSKLRTPSQIFTHGFLTINGQKMSKSRGTFILASDYLKHLDPEYLRYYLATKLNDSVEDVDLNLADLVQSANSGLVGKIVNIISRCANFITKYHGGRLATSLPSRESSLLNKARALGGDVAVHYASRNYHQAIKLILNLADEANRYIDDVKPWNLAKNDPEDPMIAVCATLGVNIYRAIIIMLAPVVPKLAERSKNYLEPDLARAYLWEDLDRVLLGATLVPFQPLLERVNPASIQPLVKDAVKH